MKALLDTNILIDYLNGIESAREEIGRYDAVMISAVTWMEVMIGTTDEDEAPVRAFLSRFAQVAVNGDVAERAVVIRRQLRMRLPDAIIWASAKSEDALFVTRNTKDFSPDAPDVRVPYTL